MNLARASFGVIALPWLLASCAQPTPRIDTAAQHDDSGAEGYSLDRRLQLGYEAAQAWVGTRTRSSERLATADAEAAFLQYEVVSDAVAPCLNASFNETLRGDIYAQLHDGNLYNSLAAQWAENYTDAQLDEIHRVAMSGGDVSDVNHALFARSMPAPTQRDIDRATTTAAKRLFAEQPPAFIAYIRAWVKQNPPHCTLPANELAWQNAIRYEPLYAPEGM